MRAGPLVVVGASSGGIDAMQTIGEALPADFPAPICVVIHMAANSPNALPAILAHRSALPVESASDGMRLEPGHIYVAQPDRHLVVEPGVLRTPQGPRENLTRPAVDPLFRSAAQTYGPATIGVLLTGNLDDGTAGLWAVKRLGGTAIVQDPTDAPFPGMPASALRHVDVDYSVPLVEIAPLLMELTGMPAQPAAQGMDAGIDIEVNVARSQNALDAGLERIAEPSLLSCPECHGVLMRMREAPPLRFRCHTGHAYSSRSLLAALGDHIEHTIWNAVRALEEETLLLQRLAQAPDATGEEIDRAREARQQSEALRQFVLSRESESLPVTE